MSLITVSILRFIILWYLWVSRIRDKDYYYWFQHSRFKQQKTVRTPFENLFSGRVGSEEGSVRLCLFTLSLLK